MQTILHVHQQLYALQDKYTFFLLAASGAAIGFSLNQTAASGLTYEHIPLGLAILCWGISFFFGCKKVSETLSLSHQNISLLRIRNGTPVMILEGQAVPSDLVANIALDAMEKTTKKIYLFTSIQFGLFITGSIFYIGSHIWQMHSRVIQGV